VIGLDGGVVAPHSWHRPGVYTNTHTRHIARCGLAATPQRLPQQQRLRHQQQGQHRPPREHRLVDIVTDQPVDGRPMPIRSASDASHVPRWCLPPR
jgi:hypothetical protein